MLKSVLIKKKSTLKLEKIKENYAFSNDLTKFHVNNKLVKFPTIYGDCGNAESWVDCIIIPKLQSNIA